MGAWNSALRGLGDRVRSGISTSRGKVCGDMDGNEMNPQDFTVRGVEKVKPKPEDAAHEQIALEAAREGIGSFEK